jgi:hypothetical protein
MVEKTKEKLSSLSKQPCEQQATSPHHSNSDFENSLMIFKKIQANLNTSKAANGSFRLQISRNSTSARSLKYKELKKILIISERIKKLNMADKFIPKHSKVNHPQIHRNCDYVRDIAKFNSATKHQRLQNEYIKPVELISNSANRKSFKEQESLKIFNEKSNDSFNLSRSIARSEIQHKADNPRSSDLYKKHSCVQHKKIRKKLRDNAALLKKNLSFKKMSLLKNQFYYKNIDGKNSYASGTHDYDSIFTPVTTNDYQFTFDCMSTSYSSNYFKSDLTSVCNSEDEMRFRTMNKTSTRKCLSKKRIQNMKKSEDESQSNSSNSSLTSSRSNATINQPETLFDETDEPSFEFARADDDFDTNEQIKSHHDILNDSYNVNETEVNGKQDSQNRKNSSDEVLTLILHRLPGKFDNGEAFYLEQVPSKTTQSILFNFFSDQKLKSYVDLYYFVNKQTFQKCYIFVYFILFVLIQHTDLTF